jgi:iron complex outermembrane receptor protein
LRFFLLVNGLALSGMQAQEVGGDMSPETLKKLSLSELMEVQIPTVYSASRHDQKVTEAPSSVSIITGEDVKQYGYRTLGDMLNSVSGFYQTYNRSYQNIGVRGLNPSGNNGGRILVMVDGHRINDPIFDSGTVGQDFPLDVDLIDRVEVIRGPGSALYGNNAVFAVVNVVTRRGRDVQGVEASGATASLDEFTGRLTYGQRFTNGVEVMVSSTFQHRDGNGSLYFPEFKGIRGGMADNSDGERVETFFGSVSYGDFTFTGLYGDRQKFDPTAHDSTVFGDPRERDIDDRGYGELKYQHEFADDWQVMSRGYYDYSGWRWDAPVDLDTNSAVASLYHQKTWSHSVGGEAQVARTFFDRHRLTLGIEGRQDLELAQLAYVDSPHSTVLDSRGQNGNLGVYLQEEITIRTNLLLNLGGR